MHTPANPVTEDIPVSSLGFLADHLPPVATNLKYVSFNANGTLWTCPRDSRLFQQVEGTWSVAEVTRSVGGLLDTEHVIQEAVLVSEDQTPLGTIKVLSQSVTADMYPTVLIRLFNPECSLIDLNTWDTMPPHVLDDCLHWVRQRRNILICGPQNAGCTSLATALLRSVDPEHRIVVWGQVKGEMLLTQPNSINLHTLENREGVETPKGHIPKLATAVSLEPGYLIADSIRSGAACVDMCNALQAGIPGLGITAGHNPTTTLSYLQLYMARGRNLDPATTDEIVLSSFMLFIHMDWVTQPSGKEERRVVSIVEPLRYDSLDDLDEEERKEGRYTDIPNSSWVFRRLWHHARFPHEVLPMVTG